MPRIEGKTINELLRVEDITGAEIIPMSVYSEEYCGYVTRGITVDNFFKTIYGMIQEAEQNISYVKDDMTAYVDELRAYDNALHNEDVRLDSEQQKTNAYLAYHAEDLILLHEHYHRITAYSYEGIGRIGEAQEYISAYAYEGIGGLNDKHDKLHAYTYSNVGELWENVHDISAYAYEGIGKTEEMVVTAYDNLSDRIAYEHNWNLGYMATAYSNLEAEIAYVAAYAEGGSGELAEKLAALAAYSYAEIGDLNVGYESLAAYTYEGIGRNSYTNLNQDITLAHHANAIAAVAQNVAYESYVNTIQSGHINTIYYENSDDAFNDWSNPDDDNVKPQQ